MGIMTFFPLGFLPGYVLAWACATANLLRVPPEVELEGLDVAEFGMDFYPEYGVVAGGDHRHGRPLQGRRSDPHRRLP